jgi:hypothetical protein
VKVKDFVVPGSQNSTVPAGIDIYMNDPEYIFVVATQTLSTLHVPQGAFFDFLTKYGAGPELQKLEQLNVVYGCGNYGNVSYALTGQCGPRGGGKPNPPSYEKGSIYGGYSALMLMSLMPGPNGAPADVDCDRWLVGGVNGGLDAESEHVLHRHGAIPSIGRRRCGLVPLSGGI